MFTDSAGNGYDARADGATRIDEVIALNRSFLVRMIKSQDWRGPMHTTEMTKDVAPIAVAEDPALLAAFEARVAADEFIELKD